MYNLPILLVDNSVHSSCTWVCIHEVYTHVTWETYAEEKRVQIGHRHRR